MSRVKDQYNDTMPGAKLTKQEFAGHQHAQEEYYAEQRRHQRNKERAEREKNAPTAPPVTPRYEGRRTFMANPATDAKRFEQVCREADKEATRTGDVIVVFKNRENQYFTWEEKYISEANDIEALYRATPEEGKKKK